MIQSLRHVRSSRFVATHKQSRRARCAVTSVDAQAWLDIEFKAGLDVLDGYQLMPQSKPSSSGSPVLPTEPNVPSSKRVVLYRDTNGWCPYCQKVWMSLHEKGVDFDTVLINLQDKPEWYSDVASNNQTPAVRLDGEYLCESLDILLALEEQFPEVHLLPSNPETAEAVHEFLGDFDGYATTLNLAQRPEMDAEAEAEVVSLLDRLESSVKSHGGPFLFGEFSLADITVAPFMPLLQHAPHDAVNLSKHPHLKAAMHALEERESYRVAATDLWTRKRILKFFTGSQQADTVDCLSGVSERDMRERREAAAKLAANREVIINKLVARSGVVHKHGSMYGVCWQDMNGRAMNPFAEQVEAVVESALQRVCMQLVTGSIGSSPEDPEATSIQVSAVAYLRNLASAPRDMSSGAAEKLRDACDVFMQQAYEFPEPWLVAQMRQRFAQRRAEDGEKDGTEASSEAETVQ